MSKPVELSRRSFIQGSLAGLTLAFALPMKARGALLFANQKATMLNAFLNIAPDGRITYFSPFIEMGQGTYTSLPMIIAEELDADLAMFEVEQAPLGDDYKLAFGGTMRITGGSTAVRSSYDIMRQVGASVRELMLQAAANYWKVPAARLITELGFVVDAQSGERIGYGMLAPLAAQGKLPSQPKLKNPADFRYIGKPVKRTDSFAKSHGQAKFGIDISVPGMVYATVKKNPVFGKGVRSFNPEYVMNMPGVLGVEPIPGGVAVIADSFWHAKKGLDQLEVEFETSESELVSSESISKDMRTKLDVPGVEAENRGDVVKAFKEATQKLEAVYEVPFLAHVTMEPMNCTAWVTKDKCELWAPNQGVDTFAQVAAQITGLPLEKILVHTPYLGGGFGRRSFPDYAVQAVLLSKQLSRPVKLVWTREEDISQDFYRPMTLAKHQAAFNSEGALTAWQSTLVGDGPWGRLFGLGPNEADRSVIEGATHQPYAVENRRVEWLGHQHPVPVGWWRSVGHSYNGFITESFVDEMADTAGVEPVAFRRMLLVNAPRFLKVLETAIQMADYQPGLLGGNAPYAMGFAMHESFGSIVAQVAKVTLESGQPRVLKVWCVVDCGMMVNPNTIEAQMQSGISTGLSQALFEELVISEGRVQQSNFHDYPILPPHLMPEVAVSIIESGAPMGGIGEPGTPPIAAAVANALFKLSGVRVRRLPMKHYNFEYRMS